MQPSVGRITHYVSHGTPIQPDGSQAYTKHCRFAGVTEVGPLTEEGQPDVGLCVSNPTGLFFYPLAAGGCRYDEGSGSADWSCDGLDHEDGIWHWPVRVTG